MAEPLSAAQLTTLEKGIKDQLLRTVEHLQLRKAAMDHAVALWMKHDMCSPPWTVKPDGSLERTPGVAYTAVELAQMIYDFTTAPVKEIVVKIEQ